MTAYWLRMCFCLLLFVSFRIVSIYVQFHSCFISIVLLWDSLRLPHFFFVLVLFFRLARLPCCPIRHLRWCVLNLFPTFFFFKFSLAAAASSSVSFLFGFAQCSLQSPPHLMTSCFHCFIFCIFCIFCSRRLVCLPCLWHRSVWPHRFLAGNFCLIFYVSVKRLLLFRISYGLLNTALHREEWAVYRRIADEWLVRTTSSERNTYFISTISRDYIGDQKGAHCTVHTAHTTAIYSFDSGCCVYLLPFISVCARSLYGCNFMFCCATNDV